MTKKTDVASMQAIINHSCNIFFIISKKGIVTYVSPSLSQLNIKPNTLVDTSFYELVSKKDKDNVKNNLEGLIEHQDQSSTFTFETKKGHILETTAKNLLDHQDINGILLNVYDITNKSHIKHLEKKNKQLHQEIKKQKELQSQLQGRKEQYQLLINYANEGICVAQNGSLKFVNPKLCNILHYSEKEMLHKPFLLFIHPEDQDMVTKRYKKRVQGKKAPEEYTFRIIDKKGHTHWVQIHAAQFLWNDKPATVNFLNEISEKVYIQKKFEKLFDLAPLLTAEIEADTFKIISVNKAFQKSIGIPSKELIGKKADEILSKKIFKQRCQHAKKAVKEDRIITNTDRRDGRYFYNTYLPVDAPGGKKRLFVIAQDITEIRVAEQKYRRLVDSSPDAIAEVDGKTEKILTVNPAMANNFKTTKENIIGKDWKSLIPKEVYKKRYVLGLKAIKEDTIQIFEDERKGHYFQNIFVPFQTDQGYKNLQVISRDITKQKQIQKQLEYNRDYLDNIINLIGDPVFVKDRNHNWILLNDAYCEFMGYNREELLGKSDYDFFPKKEADVFWKKDEEAFETGMENINEEKFTDKKGVIHTIQTRKKSYVDKNGKKILVGIIHDMTEQKQVEKALRENEEKFRAVTTSAQDAIIIINTDGEIIFWNTSAERIFGYSSSEVIGKKVHKLLMPQKDDLSTVFKGLNQFKKQGTGPVIGKTQDLLTKKKNGNIFPVELSISSIKIKDKRHAVGIVRDITERKKMEKALRESKQNLEKRVKERTKNLEKTLKDLKESEQRYRSLIETAPVGIAITDMKGNVLDMNPAIKEMSGYNTENFDFERHYVHKTDRKKIYKLLKKQGSIRNYELELIRKDGEQYTALIDVEPIQYKNRSVYLTIQRDITEIKKAEQQLKQVHDYLNNVINSASEFIFTIDQDKKVSMWNKTAEKVTGKSVSQVNGKTINQLSFIVNPQVLYDYIKNISLGYSPSENEVIIKTKQGENAIFKISCSLITGVKQDTFGYLIVGQNVTKAKYLQERFLPGSSYLQYKTDVSLDESLLIDLKLPEQSVLLLTRGSSTLLYQKTKQKQMDIDTVYLDDSTNDTTHVSTCEDAFSIISAYIQKHPSAVIIVDRLDYLIMNHSFERVLRLIYRLNSRIDSSNAVFVLRINSDMFTKKQLSLLKEEFLVFEQAEVEEVSLEESLYQMLSFIHAQNQRNVVVSYSKVGKYFNISKVTTGKRISELKRKGLVSISLKGRMKSIYVTKKAEDLLSARENSKR